MFLEMIDEEATDNIIEADYILIEENDADARVEQPFPDEDEL